MTRITPGVRRAADISVKPSSNIYTVMLVIAFVFVVTAIVFNELDVIGRYGVEWWKTIWPF